MLLLWCVAALCSASASAPHATLCLGPSLCSGTVCSVSAAVFPVGQCQNSNVTAFATPRTFRSWQFTEQPERFGSQRFGVVLYPLAGCSEEGGGYVRANFCPQGTCCSFSDGVDFPAAPFVWNGTLYAGFVAGEAFDEGGNATTGIIVGMVLGLGVPVAGLLIFAIWQIKRRAGYEPIKQADDELM